MIMNQEPELKCFTTSLSTNLQKPRNDCVICNSPAIYKCPKCSAKTCSANCSKSHKSDQNCDGQNPTAGLRQKKPWCHILAYNQFKEETTSIKDQHFLRNIAQTVRAKAEGEPNNGNAVEDGDAEDMEDRISVKSPSLDHLKQSVARRQFSQLERSLLQNAQFRRIWLRLDEEQKVSNNSYHEHFSDTIFWTCTVKFVCRHSIQATEGDDNNSPNAPSSLTRNGPIVIGANKPGQTTLPIVDYELDEDEAEEQETAGNNEARNEEEDKIASDDHCDHEVDDDDDNGLDEGHDESMQWLTYTVHNIPETIRLHTLLRQFLRPKPHGTVISRSQLDMPRLEPFIRAYKPLLSASETKSTDPVAVEDFLLDENGPWEEDNLHFYMQVELSSGHGGDSENDQAEKEENIAEMRYYSVNPEQTILENLRNRHVIGHPCFVVVLRRRSEFGELELPMMGEVEQKLLQAERERVHEGTGSFSDRPKWQQRNNGRRGRGGGGGSQSQNRGGRGGRGAGREGRRQQPACAPMQYHHHQQQPPIPPPAHPHHFYHPYVVANQPPPPFHYQQQQPTGWQQQWHAQQPIWIPPNSGWRGGKRGRRN